MASKAWREVTNVCPKRGKKKAIWFKDSAKEQVDDCPEWFPNGSRYGPERDYVANCTNTLFADILVAAWNAYKPASKKKVSK